MKFHIVRNNESLEDILFLYNLTKDELVEQNRHVRVWDRLISGTKLKIPPIPESVEQDVSDMEPFVEDYYPKLSEQFKEDEVFLQDNNEDEQKIDISTFSEQIIDHDQFFAEEKALVEEEKDLDEKVAPIPKNITSPKSVPVVKINSVPEEVKKLQKQINEAKSKNDVIEEKPGKETSLAPPINIYQPIYNQPAPSPNPYLGYYNYPRYVPYPVVYYPVYYQKRPK